MICTVFFSSSAGSNSNLKCRNLSLPMLGRDHKSQTRVLPSVKATTAQLLLCGNALLPTQGSSGLVISVSSHVYMKYSHLPKVLRFIHNVSQVFVPIAEAIIKR